jgi:geranylgeranyl diphosphate synthase type 3
MSTPPNHVLEPYEYLVRNPGKDFRSHLVAAFEKWIPIAPGKSEIVKEVIAMLHTASLLVDDVEDDSELRRGQPVAHKIYGVAQTINSANYVYFKALQKVNQLEIQDSITFFTEELLNLHIGQGNDIYWRDNIICPTESEYLQMVSDSTLMVKLRNWWTTTTSRETDGVNDRD